jgi:hypothetical protein
MNDKKIKVEVAYTGQDPYQDSFAPEVPLDTVKRKAMHQFGIEASAADQYALQLASANLDDKATVGSLGKSDVTLTLVLKKPQEKGYVG